MHGWLGKILRVNLTDKKISVEELDERLAKAFIGGRGLGVKYLVDEINPNVDPLSSDNKLIFVTGPATGTYALGSSRYEVVTKAPLSGTIAGSNSGGYWGPELKFAGYDMIIIEGKAGDPVYLLIENERVEIRCAKSIWGKNTFQTQELIKGQLSEDVKIACIGISGERLVKFACIINDEGRAAGRTGVGAVMGSKNLKAIAVRGTNKVLVADEQRLRKLNKESFDAIPKPIGLSTWGTSYGVEFANEVGILPTRNFRSGIFEGAKDIGGRALHERFFIKRSACYRCPIACGRVTRVADSPFEGEGPGPEFEGLASLGSACGVDNLAAIIKAYYLCNEFGMDVISCGYTISCAMELFEKGFLPQKDVGNKLNFGDAETLIEFVKKTGAREGFGDLLAEGSYRLAKRYGHPEFSMTVKKVESPGYDPRGAQGVGLSYATSTAGASHMRSQFENLDALGMVFPEIGVTSLLDGFATSGKAAFVIKCENDKTATDSMGICTFISGYKIGLQNVVDELEAITGVSYGIDNWMKAGERIYNLERIFNLRAGFKAEDDTLPKRFLEEPLPEGPAKGYVCNLAEMLPEYYQLRGWDSQGRPTEAKLRELTLL